MSPHSFLAQYVGVRILNGIVDSNKSLKELVERAMTIYSYQSEQMWIATFVGGELDPDIEHLKEMVKYMRTIRGMIRKDKNFKVEWIKDCLFSKITKKKDRKESTENEGN